MPDLRPILFVTAPALLALSAACSSGGSSGDGTESAPPDPALVAQFRGVVSAQGILAAPAAPVLDTALVELGRALYFDKELSGNRDVSCSTCHLASEHGSDGRTLPRGVDGAGVGPARVAGEIVPRHSPINLNAGHGDAMFWDGRIEVLPGGALRNPADAQLTAAMQAVFTPGLETLAAQAMFPPTSRAEMRGETGENELADIADGDFTGIWEAIVDRFVAIPTYANMLTDAYPGTALVDFHMGHLANALAAFQATELHRVDSPFQRFLAGDDGALTTPQLRGALQYFGPQGRCSVCHVGPLLSDFRYHNIGMPQLGPGKGDGVGSDDDFGREQVTGAAAERYRFRTPSLLNVELTAPYGHAGQFSTLESMVRHYRNVTNSLNTYDIMEHVSDTDLISTQLANESDVLANLSGVVSNPLNFDVDDMVEFMRALTADSARDLSDVVPVSVPSGSTVDG
ncbi:MAG: cytochrome c peroxidase [Planctomycetota bacterium]